MTAFPKPTKHRVKRTWRFNLNQSINHSINQFIHLSIYICIYVCLCFAGYTSHTLDLQGMHPSCVHVCCRQGWSPQGTTSEQCHMVVFVADDLGFFAAQDSRPRDRALSIPRHCLDAQTTDRGKNVTRPHRAPVTRILGPENQIRNVRIQNLAVLDIYVENVLSNITSMRFQKHWFSEMVSKDPPTQERC